jgi:hypothetical protein
MLPATRLAEKTMQTTILSNTIVTNQRGNPNAGLQATATEPRRPRTMADLINDFPGKPWCDAVGPLTQWTLDRLVNRDDVYRAYKSLERRYPNQLLTYTAPWFEDAREFGSLTSAIIEEHYRSDQEKLIGLHAISVENTCRWFAIDVDQHGDDGPVLGEKNVDAAFSWYEELQEIGFHPVLVDANGAGGYHLLVCLSRAAPSGAVHGFLTDFVQDFRVYGLRKALQMAQQDNARAILIPAVPGRSRLSKAWGSRQPLAHPLNVACVDLERFSGKLDR